MTRSLKCFDAPLIAFIKTVAFNCFHCFAPLYKPGATVHVGFVALQLVALIHALVPDVSGAQGIQSLDLPLSERVMSGLTLGLTHRAYERIKKELEDCCRRVVAIAKEREYQHRCQGIEK